MGLNNKGGFIAEWYGFRVWMHVDKSDAAVDYQSSRDCPFITLATGSRSACKKQKRTGICTISSDSNGTRQDWLACPFRILDTRFTLLDTVVRHLYGVSSSQGILLHPVSVLGRPEIRHEIIAALIEGKRRVFVFSENELGGEVKVPQTAGSPQIEVDSSIVELLPDANSEFRFGKHMFFELQTMDFHGSPLHAVARFKEALESKPKDYHDDIESHPDWAGDSVEGPNKANVFKRTIYQIIIEIQLSRDKDCAGFAIALPEPVWDSWRTHLGLPELEQDGAIWRLQDTRADTAKVIEPDRAWIFVFDIDRDSPESPQPLKVVKIIATTSASLIYFAFERAPEQAIALGGLKGYRQALEYRARSNWFPATSGPRRRTKSSM